MQLTTFSSNKTIFLYTYLIGRYCRRIISPFSYMYTHTSLVRMGGDLRHDQWRPVTVLQGVCASLYGWFSRENGDNNLFFSQIFVDFRANARKSTKISEKKNGATALKCEMFLGRDARTGGRADRQTDRRTDRQTDTSNNNTLLAYGKKIKIPCLKFLS